MVIFHLDVVHNWLNKLPQKSMDEESSPSVAQVRVLSFGSGGVKGLISFLFLHVYGALAFVSFSLHLVFPQSRISRLHVR